MKAAVLHAFGSRLSVEQIPQPEIGTGEVLVRVVATGVLPYTNEVLSAVRNFQLELPIVLGTGGIGRVERTGPDSTRLKVGDWVAIDGTVRSRDDARTPDIQLQGWSARGIGGLQLQRYFHDGTFAEFVRIPTENAVSIGEIDEADASRWCALNLLLVPYGGFLAADLRAGETALVSGATGNFGSAAVTVALAMGAACVVAPGRNATMLRELERRFGDRVRTVELTGDEAADRERMKAAAPGPIDVVLDILPPLKSTAPTRAAAMTVREFGRVVLQGGVGMLGGEDLSLPYPWLMRNSVTIRGRWMYPREAVAQLAAFVRAGLVDLGHFSKTDFDLDHVNDAIDHAASDAAPFRMTILRPGGSAKPGA